MLGVLDLLGSPQSPARARVWVRRKLGADHPALEDVTRLVSEVVTNAVVHSDSRDGGRITLALADCFDRIHADVVDDGGESVPRVCVSDDFAESGRGMMLVDLLSQAWGVYEDEAGRTVWFEVEYRRDRHSDALACPRQREAFDSADSAVRSTAVLAARTVAESVERECRGRHARRLARRWDLDRAGLDAAADALVVEPLTDAEMAP
ncbi:ATP-binding protein [Sphaerisporangium sp. NPDC005288]|uniref:ATP-binding protein n=1 Tax=Sphaerisporangium sp. NPDC005288 TaxID=3155114 RepID=UPI0033BE0E87